MALYLDTETTGLSPRNGDTIVEVAIVDDRGVALIDTLVNPMRSIPWHASNVHGISDAMVRGQPTLADLMPQIRRIVAGQQVVIYNATFDTPFFPGGLREARRVDCAMRRYAQAAGGGTWKKLDVAAERAGHIWSGTAHRACADALACRSVWNWLEGVTQNQAENPKPSVSAATTKMIGCPKCGQRLRVPAGKVLDVTCTACRAVFRLRS